MNWVFFPTAAVRRVHPTTARRVFQRDQEIQSLPKDRCFLLQNFGNPLSGRDHDDDRRLGGFEGREGGVHHVHRAHDVDLEAPPPPRLSRRDPKATDVGDHDVEAPERLRRGLDPRLYGRAIAYIHRPPGRCDALLRQGRYRGANGRGILRTEPHMTAFRREGLGDGPVDAPSAARDECLFPRQSQIPGALPLSS
jgi:hypothetical protein